MVELRGDIFVCLVFDECAKFGSVGVRLGESSICLVACSKRHENVKERK